MVAAAISGCLLSPLGIGLLLVVILLLYLKFSYFPFQVLENTGIKGPSPSFFFGNYRALTNLGFLKYLKHLHEKYGHIVSFYIGVRPCISVTDTDLIKSIIVKDFNHFMNRSKVPDFFAGRKPDETQGLLQDRDDVWRVGRQTLSPTFSSAKIKAMTPLIQNSVKTLVEVFRERADSEKSFKIVDFYRRFTMETIFATAFGRVVDIQRNKSDPLVEAGAIIFGTYDSSSGESLILFFVLMYDNFPWLEPVTRYMIQKSAEAKAFKMFTDIAIQIIKERRAETEPGRYKDLLQLMIDATVEEGESSQKKLTDKEITAHATLFMLAGHETTSNSLTFTSYLLALNPDIQEKLQEEIDSYFEEYPEASLYQAAHDVSYLDMVIQESSRMYSVAVIFDRECGKDYTYKNITIPKGTTVFFPVTLLHKDPEYWEDPEKFDPMRFTSEKKAKRPQHCYLPFGAGPRICIGMRFALLELKMALIELLREFTFVRAPDTAMSLELGIGGNKTPVYLKVVKRNK